MNKYRYQITQNPATQKYVPRTAQRIWGVFDSHAHKQVKTGLTYIEAIRSLEILNTSTHKPVQSEETSMNKHTHIATLLQTGFYTIGVIFVDDKNPDESSRKIYTYKVPSKMPLEINQFAIVDVNGKLEIVKVKEIHAEPQIDLSAKYPYKWIVQPVQTETYSELVSLEKTIEQQFFKQQQKAARQKYFDNLGLDATALPGIIHEAKALFDHALGAESND